VFVSYVLITIESRRLLIDLDLMNTSVSEQYKKEMEAAKDMLWQAFSDFNKTWDVLISIYVPLEIAIMCFGLVRKFFVFASVSHNQ